MRSPVATWGGGGGGLSYFQLGLFGDVLTRVCLQSGGVGGCVALIPKCLLCCKLQRYQRDQLEN